MVTVTDNFITVDDIKLHYTEFGERRSPHMLCLHGFTLEAHSWDELAERMSERYHIVCPSVPGHGDSDRRASYADPFADIHLIGAFMDAIEMPSATVLGHSMGGSYAGGLAIFHPAKVERIVMVDAGLDTRAPGAAAFQAYVDEWQAEHPSAQDAYDWISGHFPETKRGPLGAWAKHSGNVHADGTFRWKLDPARMALAKPPQPEAPEVSPYWPMLSQIKCPVLIVRGDKSQLLRQTIVEQMTEALPDGGWTLARGVGHGMHLEDVDAVYDAMREFLGLP